ncbi:hypothetical protein AEP_00668 [Curvibacter sp. AEP1-3]|uniref:Nmad2 family putative nucleotide modification protein n=1 Tax=Curvibacter sp. AEP1-3 TaxID=1844971 RepID=UPI000B568361|nr:hypothetical protein [Curvibacter sp. AEP1-3]ARV17628.1 hypothetical protein AEP_00668 [Curvibacter sp. AEP1-3]
MAAKGLLMRVGIDATFGHFNAPIHPNTLDYLYLPIPESKHSFHTGMETTYQGIRPFFDSWTQRNQSDLVFPEHLLGLNCHLDPDFESLTYGDQGIGRGNRVVQLEKGDFIAFFASFRSIPTPSAKPHLVYALFGILFVDKVCKVSELTEAQWNINAHSRRLTGNLDDLVVFGCPERSGRFEKAIPIGDYRSGAYRVTHKLLEAWGGLSVNDGFIQRSAVPPWFSNPVNFLSWLDGESPRLLHNNFGHSEATTPMKTLSSLSAGNRLFTYKVMYDSGSAPNPDHSVCTLALCKPAIRRVANVGDLVVGFAPGDSGRLVYCMRVTHVLTWAEYIEVCNGRSAHSSIEASTAKQLTKKVPKNAADSGDCIWTKASQYERALPSFSGHIEAGDFEHDVLHGCNVLLSTEFWYFGNGEKTNIQLSDGVLHNLIPGRGHKSNANSAVVDGTNRLDHLFIQFFNQQLEKHNLREYGVYGTPAITPNPLNDEEIGKCRRLQRDDDLHDDEDPPTRC